eukprot:TRINITY_DN4841_c0_g2_i1.p1 TRINITY_DN4841_c0_g2~~TRINITY_DN4841_c0_g2_i1.p1  ORF type:complete len:276 (-),score=41.00 TRINITY_DN4841_c0_g2_i1:172-999(-)
MEDNIKEVEVFDFDGIQIEISCVNPLAHLRLCSSENESFGQSCNTGLRVFAGASAMCWFLLRHSHLVLNKKVVELGCGCGLSGIMAARFAQEVCLTDGQQTTLDLAAENTRNIAPCRVSTALFDWSSLQALDQSLESLRQQIEPIFDVVIGTELMYFRVDVECMLRAAHSLMHDRSLFLMTHCNRLTDGNQKLHDAARDLNMWVAFVPLLAFLSKEEIAKYGWSNVECCVLGKGDPALMCELLPNLDHSFEVPQLDFHSNLEDVDDYLQVGAELF